VTVFGLANPICAIGSAALLLEHFGLDDEAARLRKAIDATIGAAILTKDIGSATTDDVTAPTIDQLEPAPAGYTDGDPSR